jgi:hypothetical protein
VVDPDCYGRQRCVFLFSVVMFCALTFSSFPVAFWFLGVYLRRYFLVAMVICFDSSVSFRMSSACCHLVVLSTDFLSTTHCFNHSSSVQLSIAVKSMRVPQHLNLRTLSLIRTQGD